MAAYVNNDPRDLYPLATSDGKYIPLDVFDPVKFLKIAFTGTATTAIALPAGKYIMKLRASAGCFVKFANAVAVDAAAGTVYDDTLHLFADQFEIVYPYTKYISVIGEGGGSGNLFIQFMQQWHGLTTQQASVRG